MSRAVALKSMKVSTRTAPARDSEVPVPEAPWSWLRGRVWLMDLLVVIAVFAYNLPILLRYTHATATNLGLVLVSVALCLPHLWRRRHPLGTFGAILVAACAQLVFSAPLLPADVMLLLAVYHIATRYRWRASLACTLLVVVWLLVAAIPHLGRGFIDVGQLGLLVVVTLWVWTWGTLVRTRREHVAGLRERAEQAERERETKARIAVADERARIAREIHDIVSHSLSVVVVMSEGAAAKVDADPAQAKEAMLRVRDTGRTALAEMRRMLGVLRDDEPGSHAPQPGVAQLDGLIEQSRAAGLPVAFTVTGDPTPLSQGAELTIYRIVQEALTNARKHAGPAARATVDLAYLPDGIEVRVRDNGRGPVGEPGGHGLAGMRARVAMHGGTLTARPGRGGGFEVVAVLPREEQ